MCLYIKNEVYTSTFKSQCQDKQDRLTHTCMDTTQRITTPHSAHRVETQGQALLIYSQNFCLRRRDVVTDWLLVAPLIFSRQSRLLYYKSSSAGNYFLEQSTKWCHISCINRNSFKNRLDIGLFCVDQEVMYDYKANITGNKGIKL